MESIKSVVNKENDDDFILQKTKKITNEVAIELYNLCNFCIRVGPHKCNHESEDIHLPENVHSPDDSMIFEIIGDKSGFIENGRQEPIYNKKDDKLQLQATKQELDNVPFYICCKNCFSGQCKLTGFTIITSKKNSNKIGIYHLPDYTFLPSRDELKEIVHRRQSYSIVRQDDQNKRKQFNSPTYASLPDPPDNSRHLTYSKFFQSNGGVVNEDEFF